MTKGERETLLAMIDAVEFGLRHEYWQPGPSNGGLVIHHPPVYAVYKQLVAQVGLDTSIDAPYLDSTREKLRQVVQIAKEILNKEGS